MRIALYAGLGFVVGCVLAIWSVLLLGAGEGTSTPFVASAPIQAWVAANTNPGYFGSWLLVLTVGVLWAAYFGVLPAISSFVTRMLAMVLIAGLHLGAAAWILSKDVGVGAEYHRYPNLMIGYFVFLCVVVMTLAAVTWVGSRRRLP